MLQVITNINKVTALEKLAFEGWPPGKTGAWAHLVHHLAEAMTKDLEAAGHEGVSQDDLDNLEYAISQLDGIAQECAGLL